MGLLDGVLLVLVALGALYGAIKGLVRQVGIVTGAVVGIAAALRHGSTVAAWLARWVGSAPVRNVAGPALTFLAGYLAVVVVAALIHRLLTKASLGWLNRAAGAALGIATTVLVIGAALLVVTAHVPSARSGIARSPVAVEVIRGCHLMITLVPEEVRGAFSHAWEEVESIVRAKRRPLDRRRPTKP